MNKSLVLCCDGTWNTADQVTKNGEVCVTNVLKLASRVAKEKNAGVALQIIYYDQGVGTHDAFDRIAGGAFGEGLEDNINDGYRFLVANFEPGDDIYLFGFSRGAYTARSIAGMIRRCGILRRDAVRQYPRAKELYRSGIAADDPNAVAFRGQNAIEDVTPIKCIGVWDTVGALGIPLRAFGAWNQRKYQFIDTKLSPTVAFAFHALAVDEHRDPFIPTLWQPTKAQGQVVEQAWFAGAHSDVGGGYEEAGLSDIALEWMMACARRASLEFDTKVITALGTKPAYKQEVHDSLSAAYKLTFNRTDREIGDASSGGTEYFHRSVVERWRDVLTYRPAPLQRYANRLNALASGSLGVDQLFTI